MQHRIANQDRAVTIDVPPEERLPVRGRIDVDRTWSGLAAGSCVHIHGASVRKCRASAEPFAAIAVAPRMREAVKIGLMRFMNLDPRMMNSAGTFGATLTTVRLMTLQAIPARKPSAFGRMSSQRLDLAMLSAGIASGKVGCLSPEGPEDYGRTGKDYPGWKSRSCATNWPWRDHFYAVSAPGTNVLSRPV